MAASDYCFLVDFPSHVCYHFLSVALFLTLSSNRLAISLVTIYLFSTAIDYPTPTGPLDARLTAWATFLGLSSALLAAIQYCPQLIHTYKAKLVGALSIPMMIIQSPGAGIMVISIAMRYVDLFFIPTNHLNNDIGFLRPGTNWTSELCIFHRTKYQIVILIQAG